MSETAIKIQQVSKNFGPNKILNGIDMEVKKGEIYGIIGASGSGKSTLLNILTDIIPPTTGTIQYKIDKENRFYQISEKPEEIKKLFGYSFQHPSFHSMLTVEENLEHFAILYGMSQDFGKKNTNHILNLVNLTKAKNILGKDLSGGMQKILCFACSLIHSPKILFLDEPTSNLDPLLRKNTIEILKNINKNGTTIIIASQLLTELEELCDRIGIINNGKIIKEGTLDEIKSDYTPDTEIHLELLPGNYEKIIASLKKKNIKIQKINNEGKKLILYTPEAEKTLHNLIHLIEQNKETLLDIDLRRPSLSEVFEFFIKK